METGTFYPCLLLPVTGYAHDYVWNVHLTVYLTLAKAFSYSSPATWNSIPTSIKNCASLYSFKRHLKSHLIAQLINNQHTPCGHLVTCPHLRFMLNVWVCTRYNFFVLLLLLKAATNGCTLTADVPHEGSGLAQKVMQSRAVLNWAWYRTSVAFFIEAIQWCYIIMTCSHGSAATQLRCAGKYYCTFLEISCAFQQ